MLQEEDYCRETGMKVQVVCHDKITTIGKNDENHQTNGLGKDYRPGFNKDEYHRWKSCAIQRNDLQIFIIFQISMAIIGGLSYLGVRSRRHNAMSQFDYRKIRY